MKVKVELKSKKEVQNDCCEWAKEIRDSYDPDAIVFIAKSGFLFAEVLADELDIPVADILAGRPDNNNKDGIAKIVPWMPKFLLRFALRSRLLLRYHRKNSARDVKVTKRLRSLRSNDPQRILVVDDSVDTGWTIVKVKEQLVKMFPNAEIKVAGYCVLEDSQRLVKTDYFRYKNRVIVTATSRYSEEYREFLDSYVKWKKEQL